MSKQATRGQEELMAKSVCGACEHEQMATNKCCVECGEKLAKAVLVDEALYDEALNDLDAFAKGNMPGNASDLTLEDPDETPPPRKRRQVAAAPAGDETTADEPMGKSVQAEVGEEWFDGIPLIEMLLKANNRLASRLDQVLAGQRIMAKANHTHMLRTRELTAENRDLRTQIDGQRDRSPGRRSISLLSKSNGPGGTSLESPNDEAEDNSPRGSDLMAKARNALMLKPGILSVSEVCAVEDYTNRGASLEQIKQHDPGLGQRLEGALVTLAH